MALSMFSPDLKKKEKKKTRTYGMAGSTKKCLFQQSSISFFFSIFLFVQSIIITLKRFYFCFRAMAHQLWKKG